MKKHMALRLLGITLALFIVYILAISACYHGMSRQANLVHHLNVVRNDATNIAEHYPNIAFSEDAPTAEYFLTLEDVTHGQLMLADGGEGVYRLDDNEEVTYCTLCRLPVEVADGARRALAGETVSLTLKEPDGGIFLYACVPVAGRNLAVILRTDANAIGDAVVSDAHQRYRQRREVFAAGGAR